MDTQPAVTICAAHGCCEPIQSLRGPSPYCAAHSAVVYEFAMWLEGRIPWGSRKRADLPSGSFDVARATWAEGRTNLTPIELLDLPSRRDA